MVVQAGINDLKAIPLFPARRAGIVADCTANLREVVRRAGDGGATVVATAGPSSAPRVRGYGARVVVEYHDPRWPAHVRDATPDGVGVGAAVNAAPGGAATAAK